MNTEEKLDLIPIVTFAIAMVTTVYFLYGILALYCGVIIRAIFQKWLIKSGRKRTV